LIKFKKKIFLKLKKFF